MANLLSAIEDDNRQIERCRTDTALYQSDERLRLAAAAARFGSYDWDLLTGLVYWSPEMRYILGVTPDARTVTPGTAPEFIHAEDRGRVEKKLRASYDPRGSGTFEDEYRIVRPDGVSWVAMRGSTVFTGEGEQRRPIRATGVVMDIADRKRAEAQLRDSEERFRTLADNMSQFAWMADEKGWIFWYNKRWYDYTGTTLDEMQGWGWTKVHHRDHVDRVVARIQRSWDTGEEWEDTFPLRGKDGAYRWFLSRALPIRDDRGNIVRWFGTNTDITEQKQREEQIRLLLGEVNHRSKNMLALVQAVAKQTAKSGAEDFIHRFEQRIQAIAASQDLLVKSEWKGVRIEELVRSQLAHFDDLIGARIALHGPPVTLKGSAAQALGMALHELATNAGKYGALSNEAGSVELSWNILDANSTGPRFTMCWVERNGPRVMPPLRHGFGSTVIDRLTSTALGASVALDYAPEGLMWRLECSDARILEDASVIRGGSDFPVPNASRPGKRILIVEDEPLLAMEVAATLEETGYVAVGPASSVGQALALLDHVGCDCAILDINLGTETAEPVAHRLLKQGVPFLTISGYSDDQRPQVFKRGPFLSKPLRPALVVAEIERCMCRSKAGVG